MAVDPIPKGYHTVTPYLIVEGAATLLEFVKSAFGAQETVRMDMPDGKVAHAEFKIGDSRVMLGDATEQFQAMPGMLHLYVEDCDAVFKRAVEAGGKVIQEPADQFYGDRSGGVADPVGNQWWLATHIEDVDPEELARRSEEAAKSQS